MPSQHKHPPVSFRPGTQPGDPEGDRAWLYAYAGRTGRQIGAILSEALAAYRAAHEATGTVSRTPGTTTGQERER